MKHKTSAEKKEELKEIYSHLVEILGDISDFKKLITDLYYGSLHRYTNTQWIIEFLEIIVIQERNNNAKSDSTSD